MTDTADVAPFAPAHRVAVARAVPVTTSSTPRSAVVFDPQPLWLTGVGRVLERINVDVRVSTSSPDRVRRAIDEHRPELFVTELIGDPAAALEWIRGVRDQVSSLRVIVLSAHQDRRYVDAALAGGAAAYVTKTAHPDDLASAVRQAFQLSIYYARTKAPAAPATANEDVEELTRRELEILRLVADGRTNAQVARKLWVTEQTVKFHLANVYKKLGVANRTEASRWAQVRGLLPDSEPV